MPTAVLGLGEQLGQEKANVQGTERLPRRGGEQWAGVVTGDGLECGTGLGVKGRGVVLSVRLLLVGTGNPEQVFLPLSIHCAHLPVLGPQNSLLGVTAIVWEWDGARVMAEHGHSGW